MWLSALHTSSPVPSKSCVPAAAAVAQDRTRQMMWGGPHKAEDVGRTAQGRGCGEDRTRQRKWGGPHKAEDVGRAA